MENYVLIYGSADSELKKRAIEELSRILLEQTEVYPVVLSCRSDALPAHHRPIYLGTKADNPYIKAHSTAVLSEKESYHIQVKDNTVMIEGFDDAGILYGALDFYDNYIVKHQDPLGCVHARPLLTEDALPDFSCVSAPSVRERGLWTWGHVIYDYRGYLDHMMRLKMNKLVIWNDFAPYNTRDIIAYAHARGIRVIWGFSWLWDTHDVKVDIGNLEGKSEKILEKYEKEYACAEVDGIYFQTFTELNEDHIDGIPVAETATAFVNRTAGLFYEKYPSLQIEFGLHATSVKARLDVMRAVDPRIHIIWEDCGAFPFSYFPGAIGDFDETMAFAERIALLRGKEDRFGVVMKGLVKLDWSRFKHLTGPQCIGVSTALTKKERIARKQKDWRVVQAYWLATADKAYEAVKALCRQKQGELSVLALVEDGVFEENMMYPVALFAQMLWDTETDIKEMMTAVALRNSVTFA